MPGLTGRLRLMREHGLLPRSLVQVDGGKALNKCLGWVDLTLLGVGAIVGAGVFVLTGVVAHRDAGPAVILSYLLAAMAALASAMCYTEFAVDMPTTGGAYNYVVHTFGEVMAWLVAWNLLLEYTLSVAAVARDFTAYFSSAIGHSPSELRVDLGGLDVHLDFPALGVVLLIGGLLCYGTKESARFNAGVTGLNIVIILFIMGVGYPLGFKASNFLPFAPYGAKGVFRGASKVFFSFVGFDSIATTAEECKNPKVDLPMGILGAIIISAVLYAGMSGAICGMVNYAVMDVDAPFAQAFYLMGMGWAAELVAVGAVTGILTSMLVSLMGATRIYVVLGRERLLPPKLCNLNEARGTPIAATLITAASAGFLAFIMDIESLADLVSIGTLFCACIVAMGVLLRRYTMPGATSSRRPIFARLLALTVCCIAFSTTVLATVHFAVPTTFAVLIVACVTSFVKLPKVGPVPKFPVPFTPGLPCLAIFACLHLICSLGWKAYVRFVVWVAVGLAIYLSYGVVAVREGEGVTLEMGELGQAGEGAMLDDIDDDGDGDGDGGGGWGGDGGGGKGGGANGTPAGGSPGKHAPPAAPGRTRASSMFNEKASLLKHDDAGDGGGALDSAGGDPDAAPP